LHIPGKLFLIMIKPKVFIPVVFLFATTVVVAWIILGNENKDDLEKAYIISPVEQQMKERIWKEIDFKEIAISDEFYSVTSMQFGIDGLLYFGDREAMIVRSFDLTVSPVDSFGNGKGNGPGEFARFFEAIHLDKDNNIWIYDSSNSRLTIFDSKTKSQFIHQTDEVSFFLIPLDSGRYAADLYQYAGTDIFNADHEKSGSFDSLVRNPELWNIIFQGAVAVHDDSSLIKAFYFTNNVARFSSNGDLIYFRKSVDPVKVNKIVPEYQVFENGGSGYTFSDFSSFKQLTPAISLSKKHIHLLVSVDEEFNFDTEEYESTRLFDVYEIESGDYRFSYETPVPVSDFAVSETHLAGISEESGRLIIWEIVDGW
jgi:hypothetical protein